MAFSPADRPKKIVTFARLEYVYRSICVTTLGQMCRVVLTNFSWNQKSKNLHFCPANNIATNDLRLSEAGNSDPDES